jgi:hypothetical protein
VICVQKEVLEELKLSLGEHDRRVGTPHAPRVSIEDEIAKCDPERCVSSIEPSCGRLRTLKAKEDAVSLLSAKSAPLSNCREAPASLATFKQIISADGHRVRISFSGAGASASVSLRFRIAKSTTALGSTPLREASSWRRFTWKSRLASNTSDTRSTHGGVTRMVSGIEASSNEATEAGRARCLRSSVSTLNSEALALARVRGSVAEVACIWSHGPLARTVQISLSAKKV